jgi:hypothetical protein
VSGTAGVPSAWPILRLLCAAFLLVSPTLEPGIAKPGATRAAVAGDGVGALLRSFYTGHGLWRDCPASRCWIHNGDWGSDSLTATLVLRWKETGDLAVQHVLTELADSERTYPAPCRRGAGCHLWSDVPMWDAVIAAREYEVLPQSAESVRKAEAAFWAVEGSTVYGVGACPTIRYQRPFGHGNHLKTLETDSNGIKAALLLFEATGERRYLTIARKRYRAVRRYFLDGRLPLYTVYVFDDGRSCRQAPGRYFASVNGNMIWNGLRLARLTGLSAYRTQALATARAVVRDLADPNGVFTDLQAENDVVEPLVEAMLDATALAGGGFARHWLFVNADAASAARRDDGTYGRFFDGPPPVSPVTAWQANGGVAVAIAAATLDPAGVVTAPSWRGAVFFERDIAQLPATIEFEGRGIALSGTLGERCCELGHARVLVDGLETTNRVGVWQNKSSSGRRFPDSILFAWRWPDAGRHRITFKPGAYDAKEGGSFLHLRGYFVLEGPSP